MTWRQPQVRQNPDPRGGPGSGQAPQTRPEWCPWHGQYTPNRSVAAFRRRAVSGEDPVDVARRLLDTAARMARTCRECRDITPTGPRWAELLRQWIERNGGKRS